MQKRYKYLVLVVYYSIAIILGFVTAFFSVPICLQQNCVLKSSFILSKMDMTVDPCVDFYKFMCGASRLTPPPQEGANNDTKSDPMQTESIFRYMINKVADYTGSTRSGAMSSAEADALFHESLLSKFFTMCERVQKTSDDATQADVRYKLSLTTYNTGMSARDLCNKKKFNNSLSAGAFEYRLRIAGFPGKHIFNAEIKRDPKDPDNMVMFVSRAQSFQTIRAEDMIQHNRPIWSEIFLHMIKFFIKSATNEDISLEIRDKVIDLWNDMKDVVTTKEDQTKNDETVKISDMQKRFPDLDFLGLLEKMGSDTEVQEYFYIRSDSKNYFLQLEKVLKKYSRQVKVAYLLFQTMWDVAPFLTFNSNINSQIRVIPSLNSQADVCKTFLGDRFTGMVLSLVIQRFNLQRNPPDVLNLVFPFYIGVMESWLRKANWMDPKTKAEAEDKLKFMKSQISLSKDQYNSIKTSGKRAEFYNGLCMQRSILTTLLCMNRFFAKKNFQLFTRDVTGFDDASTIAMGDIQYVQEKNLFQVPIFILRFPAFDSFWPVHVNFGGLGVEIGAALTAGFDYDGSHRDKFGLKRLWWTNTTMGNYMRKELDCARQLGPLAENYKAIKKMNDFRNLTDEDLDKGNLKSTTWRNLLGVRMSLKSYWEYQSSKSYRGKLLPGLEMFTKTQNFFFAHAHMRCLPPRPQAALKLNRMLYFKALSNLKEFRDAFGCGKKAGSKSTVSKAASSCTLF